MQNIILPDDTISSIGRNLQAIFPESFSERHLNKILRLLIDFHVREIFINPDDQKNKAEYTYCFNLFAPDCKTDYQEFITACRQKAAGKKLHIKIVFEPQKNSEGTGIASRCIYDVINFIGNLLFVVSNYVFMVKTGRLKEISGDFSGSQSASFISLITDVLHSANPDILVTD